VFALSSSIVRNARYAMVSALIFGILFLLPFSSQIYPDMAASLVAIVVVRKIFVEARWEEKGLGLTGALVGFSILLNPKNIVLFAVPLFYVAFMLITRKRGRALVGFLTPFLSFLLLYCFYTWYYFGSIFVSPYTSAYGHPVFDLTSNGVLGLLVDREHGLLAYFPAFYLVFLGLVASAKKLGRRVLWVGLMCTIFYGLNALFWGWKEGATTAGREILPIVVLCSVPFSTAFVCFWRRWWFTISASTLVLVTALFSVAMTWYRYLGMYGGLYNKARSVLGVDVGSFWPNFGTFSCPPPRCHIPFRPYDYLFVAIFVGYTLLVTVLAGKSSSHLVDSILEHECP
jgi:hypothetical protein